MRPQTNVHLICLGERLDDLRYPLEEGAEFLGFCWGEIPEMEAVTQGLDD
jgi:hypothetical protein